MIMWLRGYRLINEFLFHGLYLTVNLLQWLRVVSEVPTKELYSCWLPADCSKLYIFTKVKQNTSNIIVRTSQHIAAFKGRTKWFINPPIVNINTKPNANNIEGVK